MNFPLPDGSSITSNSLSNLDAATVHGAEGEVTWQPASGLTLNAGLTLLDTGIDQVTDIGGNAAKFDGNPLPFAPDVSATLGGRYAFALTRGVDASLAAHAKYRGDYYLDPEGLETRMQAGFTTLQAEAAFTFTDTGLSLTVWGRNLTDEDYALSGYGFIGYNTFRSDPRTYGVRLDYSF